MYAILRFFDPIKGSNESNDKKQIGGADAV